MREVKRKDEMTVSSDSDECNPDAATSSLRIGPIELGAAHLERLQDPVAWFDSDLVDAYFYLLNGRAKADPADDNTLPLVYAFSSFFYCKYEALGYEPRALLEAWYHLPPPSGCHSGNTSATWIRQQHLGLVQQLRTREGLLLFPIVQQGHWVLVVALLAQRQLVYYDSLYSEPEGEVVPSTLVLLDRILDFILAFSQALTLLDSSAIEDAALEDAMQHLSLASSRHSLASSKRDHRPTPTTDADTRTVDAAKEWQYKLPKNLPRQEDASSCGPFICYYAHWICQGFSEANMKFTAEHVKHFRCSEMLHLFQQWDEDEADVSS